MATDWRRCVPDDGSDAYFYNLSTGDTLWATPEGVNASDIPEFGFEDEVAAGTRHAADDGPADDGQQPARRFSMDSADRRVSLPYSPAAASPSAPTPPPAVPSHAAPPADAGAAVPPASGDDAAAGAGAGAGAGVDTTPSCAPSTPAAPAPAPAGPPSLPQRASTPSDNSSGSSGAAVWHVPPEAMCWVEPLNPVACVWEQRQTESVGHGDGEVYFVHRHTGETVWEPPEGFYDSVEDTSVLDECPEGTPLTHILAKLPLNHAAVLACADAMRKGGGVDVSLLARQAAALLAVFQSRGSDDEWRAVITAGDYALPKLLCSWWCGATPPDLATSLAQLLVLMGNLAPTVFQRLMNGEWATMDHTVQGVARFVVYATKGARPAPSVAPPSPAAAMPSPTSVGVTPEFPKEEELATWIVFLQTLCGAAKHMDAELVLPTEATVGPLFEHMMLSAAEAYNGASKALAMLSALYTNASKDPVVAVCAPHVSASSFAQALIHELNEASGGSDAGSPEATHCVLAFTQRLLRFQSDVRSFFFTNDLKVLIDVIVRELHDLNPDDGLRVEYLELLRVLLLHSQWAEKGYYRRDDILAAIESIFDGAAYSSALHPMAREAAERVLVDCAPLLE